MLEGLCVHWWRRPPFMLNRWGHAYVNPQPGFFFGVNGKPAPRDVLRNRPHGRIAFANADLAGYCPLRTTRRQGVRAFATTRYYPLGVQNPAMGTGRLRL